MLRFIIAWPLLCMLVVAFETTTSGPYSPGIPGFTAQNLASSMQAPDSEILGNHSASTQPQQPRTDTIPPPTIPSSLITAQSQPQWNTTTPQLHEDSDIISLFIRPRYLCYVTDFENRRFETINVSDYIREHGDNVDLEFVFVSYTRVQFRVATDEEIDKYTYASEEERNANRQLARSDRQQLIDWGIDAARRAGKKSFWLDFECIRNQDGIARATSNSGDVYHICDIVRAAHSMIIAIGPSAEEKVSSILQSKDLEGFSIKKVTPWLRQWGSRLWTLPELLLCPNEHRVQLYIAGDTSEPKGIAKRNFAERAWNDAISVRELVDHFEGSATLTTTQLMGAAFECFSRRQTDQFSHGDITYAIMGLFAGRYRPAVDKGDSGLQAFAKLAFKNDCGAFLNRVICLDPPPDGPWCNSADLRDRQLSDVHPRVTDILGPDIVLLDNVYGAMINWDNLDPESALEGIVPVNTFAASLVRALAIVSLIVCIPGRRSRYDDQDRLFIFVLGYFLRICTGLAAIVSLILLNRSISATGVAPSGRLIGIEGRVDASTVEKYLWGFNHGRLKVTEPQRYSDTPRQEQATPGAAGDYAFTIVDTRLMTVTHIVSDEPPTAVLVLRKRDGLENLSKHSGIRLSLSLSIAKTSEPTLQSIRPVENPQPSDHINDNSGDSIALKAPMISVGLPPTRTLATI
ncbi:hypothetical protein FGADI_13570 [Fusarium gaditjirri]|uniref:3-hydroxyisobutyrate dehydrogenase protein n=1 Tax=Fusarium gaditjirri TaxID=282569 RepID=A0A8H4SP68_9HYPO|nr:hypothetical protein FGADI_13570 [Fusarium gaditjirri]